MLHVLRERERDIRKVLEESANKTLKKGTAVAQT